MYSLTSSIYPFLINSFVNTNLPTSVEIGGTSLLIVVGVAIETAKQIQTKTMDQKYKGFIK